MKTALLQLYYCVVISMHQSINQSEIDLAELMCDAINHVLLQRGAVRSVVEVIKACREAFENPENLDEFLMMDKIADLLARVENTKVCMSFWGGISFG